MKQQSVNKESLLPPLWVLTLIGTGLIFWLLYTLKEIVTLLVMSFAISYVIEPILKKLEANDVRREVGVIAVLAIFVLLVILLIVTAIPTIAREYTALSGEFPKYLVTVQQNLLAISERIQNYIPGGSSRIEQFLASPMEVLSKVVAGVLPKITEGVQQALLKGYSLTITLVNLALLPFLIFYISVDFPDLRAKLMKLIPKNRQRQLTGMIDEMDRYVSGFVRGQISVCAILFVLYSICLGFLQIELWFLVAVVAGFGNMIPYLGTLVGVVLASIMTLVTYASFSKLIIVWGIFAVIQALEGTFITPKIMGDTVGLSPLTVILALIAGGQLFGLLGIFLAIPGAAIIRVLASHAHQWVLQKVQ